MTHTFSPAQVRSLEQRVGVLVDELFGRCDVRGRFDPVLDFAFPLPLMVICDLIGIPRATGPGPPARQRARPGVRGSAE